MLNIARRAIFDASGARVELHLVNFEFLIVFKMARGTCPSELEREVKS